MANLAAGSSTCQQLLVSAGAVQAATAVLQRYSGPGRALEAACAALMNLADAPSSHAALAEAGSVPALVAVLQSGSAPIVAELACGALRNVVAEAASSKIVTGVPGAVPALLAAAARHGAGAQADESSWAPPVLDAVCDAIQSIAEAEGARAVDAAAALPLLAQMAAAALDRRESPVLAQALAAVASVANWGKGNGAPDHAGCLAVAVRALTELQGRASPPALDGSPAPPAQPCLLGPAIEASALTCAWFFFRSADNAKAVAAAAPGLVPAVTAVLLRSRAPPLSVLRACSALRNLGALGLRSEVAAHACDPVSAIAVAMARHIESAELVADACHALHNLVVDDLELYDARLCAAGLPLRLIEAVALHTTDVTCLVAVVKVIGVAVRSGPMLFPSLLRLGAARVFSEALRAQLRDDNVVVQLANALWWLLQRYPDHATRAVVGGGVGEDVAPFTALVTALVAHEGNRAVEYAVCGAMAASLEGAHGNQLLFHPVFDEALSLVLGVLRRRGRGADASAKIADRACSILAHLTGVERHCRAAASGNVVALALGAIEEHVAASAEAAADSEDGKSVALFGFAVINHLCAFESTSAALNDEPGLCAVLLPMLQRFKGDAGIAGQIIALIANTMRIRVASRRMASVGDLLRAGGLSSAAEVISLHGDSPDGANIVEAALAAIEALTSPDLLAVRGDDGAVIVTASASEMRAAVAASGIVELMDRLPSLQGSNTGGEVAPLRAHLSALLRHEA